MELLENFEQANTSKLLFVVLAIVCEVRLWVKVCYIDRRASFLVRQRNY